MPDTAERLVGPLLLTTSGAVVYGPVPANRKVIVKFVTFANSAIQTADVTLVVGTADSVGARIVPDIRIPSKTQMDQPTWHVLGEGDSLWAKAGIADSVALTISGVVVT